MGKLGFFIKNLVSRSVIINGVTVLVGFINVSVICQEQLIKMNVIFLQVFIFYVGTRSGVDMILHGFEFCFHSVILFEHFIIDTEFCKHRVEFGFGTFTVGFNQFLHCILNFLFCALTQFQIIFIEQVKGNKIGFAVFQYLFAVKIIGCFICCTVIGIHNIPENILRGALTF